MRSGAEKNTVNQKDRSIYAFGHPGCICSATPRANVDKPIFISALESLSHLRTLAYRKFGLGHDCESYLVSVNHMRNCCLFLSQISADGTINYYNRNSQFSELYPDDIDDTFTCLHILNTYPDSNLLPPRTGGYIHPELIARTIEGLDKIRCRPSDILGDTGSCPTTDDGILFNTWYSHLPQFKSIDITAQTSVIAFFDSVGFDCTRLKDIVNEAFIQRIQYATYFEDTLCQFSEFYQSPFLPIYLFSRSKLSGDQLECFVTSTSALLQKSFFRQNNISCHASSVGSWTKIDTLLLVCAINYQLHSFLSSNNTDPDVLLGAGCNQSTRLIYEIHKIKHILKYFAGQNQSKISYLKGLNPTRYPLYIERQSVEVTTYAHSETFIKNIAREAILGSRQILSKYNKSSHLVDISTPSYTYKDLNSITLTDICTDEIHLCLFEYIEKFTADEKTYIQSLISDLTNSTDFQIAKDIFNSKFSQVITCANKIGGEAGRHIFYLYSGVSEWVTYRPVHLLSNHLLGIIGFYLYDKIIDKELSVTYLPISKYCIQVFEEWLCDIFLLINTDMKLSISHILYLMNISYLEEVQGRPIPIKNIHHKSICSSILALIVYPKYANQTISYFEHLQCARQICDDHKDFDSDFKTGKSTSMTHFLRNVKNQNKEKITRQNSDNLILGPIPKLDEEKVYTYLTNKCAKTIECVAYTQDIKLRHIYTKYIENLCEKIDKTKMEQKILSKLRDTAGTQGTLPP